MSFVSTVIHCASPYKLYEDAQWMYASCQSFSFRRMDSIGTHVYSCPGN
jgi:hypothetical protein